MKTIAKKTHNDYRSGGCLITSILLASAKDGKINCKRMALLDATPWPENECK
jgi:hypothetical protein